jgi:tetratricopeptide (TPR) repeat protein
MKSLYSLLLCSFLLLSRVSVAQTTTPEQMQQAAATFELAEKNYKVGDYEKALEGYKEAYVLSGEADLLFNIGQCQRKLNRNEEAIRSYKTFLQERPNTPIKSDVEAIIRELELAPNTPIKDEKTAPLLFGGTDTFFSIGGGLLLAGDPLPMVSALVEAKKFELQGRVAALDSLLGGLDFGGHIVSSPRSDQHVRSLLNISAGLSLSSLFSRDKFNNALGEVITNNLSFFAGLYGANSFYITCNFSARGELQFVLEALNRQSVGGVATIVKDGELDSALFVSLSAHYNLRRDPCPK